MRYVTTVEDKTFVIEVREGEIIVDGQVHVVDLRRIEPLPLYSLLVDNLSHEIFIEEWDGKYGVVLRGKLFTVQVQEERAWEQVVPRAAPPTAGGESLIKAPLSGLVVEVLVIAGQTVRAGEALLVLESMKMENYLCSPQDGVIQAVRVAAHDQVTQGQVLVIMST
ncbi:MAG: biotin/lipoyl-containing protein [Chloroflexota bacterium]|nr:biotin/lipoyl-binding protein [Anaerolineae bacterium]